MNDRVLVVHAFKSCWKEDRWEFNPLKRGDSKFHEGKIVVNKVSVPCYFYEINSSLAVYTCQLHSVPISRESLTYSYDNNYSPSSSGIHLKSKGRIHPFRLWWMLMCACNDDKVHFKCVIHWHSMLHCTHLLCIVIIVMSATEKLSGVYLLYNEMISSHGRSPSILQQFLRCVQRVRDSVHNSTSGTPHVNICAFCACTGHSQFHILPNWCSASQSRHRTLFPAMYNGKASPQNIALMRKRYFLRCCIHYGWRLMFSVS